MLARWLRQLLGGLWPIDLARLDGEPHDVWGDE